LDIETVFHKLKKVDSNKNYNSETKNLKAERNEKEIEHNKTASSRHNSGADNLSWRKISNENNKEFNLKNNYYNNNGLKKNSFAKNISSNYNSNYNSNNSYNKQINDYDIKRERFNSETVGSLSNNSNKGKFNQNQYYNNNNPYQKNFHKNSFSNVNNIYFGKNLSKNESSESVPTLKSLNNPLGSNNKNFSNEIEIDTSKIKYPLQSNLNKFNYFES